MNTSRIQVTSCCTLIKVPAYTYIYPFNSSLKPVTKCKSSFTPTNVYKGLQYHVITSIHIIICPIMRGTGTFFIDKICVRATTVKVPIRRNKFVLILAPEAQFN